MWAGQFLRTSLRSVYLGTSLRQEPMQNHGMAITVPTYRSLLIPLVVACVLAGCAGGGGSSLPPPPPPAPTVMFTTSAPDAAVNGSVVLTWSSTNATGCTASDAWSGALAASGSQSVVVTQTSTYSLTCTGGGGSAKVSTSVTAWNAPVPVVTVDASAPPYNGVVLANSTVDVTWAAQYATTCTGRGGLSGQNSTSGDTGLIPVATTTTYSLSCSNPVFSAVASSVTITVSSTLTLDVTVRYQTPGAPVVNTAKTYYVPDWTHPATPPVPFVYVELDSAAGAPIQSTWADANGVARFSGLNPAMTYTPKIVSKIAIPSLGVDFEVVNNTAPLDTSQGSFRARYGPYSTSFSGYVPGPKLVNQALTIVSPDGWDLLSASLVDANRVAGPYELLAFASIEAQTVSAAVGGAPMWRPLTILWSVQNKGSLLAPPNNFDQGVTINDGFYSSGHGSIDVGGAESGAFIAEDFIYLGGDQTVEAQDIFPYVMAHEMGHFSQAQFSTLNQPGGAHSYSDYEDPRLAWIEGNASGIAALVMNTSTQNRLGFVSGQIIVEIFDISNNTVSGNPQSWPIGWYQETTTTGLMWAAYDPNGTIRLSAAATLAPMFSSGWKQGPWLNSIWAYVYLLKQANPTGAAPIDVWSAAHNLVSVGNDVWGSTESHSGNRTAQDSLPPYTTVTIGHPVQVCSAGAPLEYNKEGNSRLLFLQGDGTSHTLTAQGPSGTVPLLAGRFFTAGSTVTAISGVVPTQGLVVSVGDCGVAESAFASQTAACAEPTAPPAEQCWLITWQ